MPTPLLQHPKARARRRRGERGGVIFIVAMTLAVLAAMGVYAIRSASYEIRASGYSRQAAQAHYLSEYGVVAAAETVNADTADLHLGLMLNASRRDTNCISLPNVDLSNTNIAQTSKACRRMGAAEIAQQFANTSQQAFPANPFGPFPLTGDFFIELTDPFQQQPPEGFGLDLGMCFTSLTVGAFGIAQPLAPGTGDAGTGVSYYTNVGLELARSRITAGPIRRCR
jgi:hypothetical protein